MTGIQVTPSRLVVSTGKTWQMTKTITPASAVNQNVNWATTASSIATVDKNTGLVTAIAAGTAQITATTFDGSYTSGSMLYVPAYGTSPIDNGEFDSSVSSWYLEDYTGSYSADYSVVTGAGMSGTNALKVDMINPETDDWKIQLYQPLKFRLEVGRTYRVSYKAKAQTARNIVVSLFGDGNNVNYGMSFPAITPAVQTYTFDYTCSDTGVNSESAFSLRFYLGSSTVSDVWLDQVTIQDITSNIAVTSVSVSPTSVTLDVGQKGQLSKTISPANATNQNVVWTSSNTAVATVSSTGLVTAVAVGSSTVTVATTDGNKTAQATITVKTPAYVYSTLLRGTTTEKYGLAKSLSVMPGDVITTEVYAKYIDSNSNNWSAALTNLMTAIAQGTAPIGTLVDGGAVGSIGGGNFPFPSTLVRTGDTGTGPKAYLNYIVFDRNYTYKTGGFRRLTTAAKENGSDVAHERLAFDGAQQIVITEPGYVYIYLSNENDTPADVYFDDFKVTHTKGPIVSSQDYYAFGLTFNSYTRENLMRQNYKFNGIEEEHELMLNVMTARFRVLDVTLGRWWQIDPKVADFYQDTPYNAMGNNPINFTDALGDEWVDPKRDGKIAASITRGLDKTNERLAKQNEKLQEKIDKAQGNAGKIERLVMQKKIETMP